MPQVQCLGINLGYSTLFFWIPTDPCTESAMTASLVRIHGASPWPSAGGGNRGTCLAHELQTPTCWVHADRLSSVTKILFVPQEEGPEWSKSEGVEAAWLNDAGMRKWLQRVSGAMTQPERQAHPVLGPQLEERLGRADQLISLASFSGALL